MSSTSTSVDKPTANADIEMDGSTLEGGGQILRVSLVLATLLRKSLRIHSIRAGRPKPGLQPQHLAGVKLVADIGQAQLQNGAVGSTEICLEYPVLSSSSSSSPTQRARRDEFVADPGTAGSITLLIQASLPCLSFSSSPERSPVKLTLRGGTTVSHSPSIDYFIHVTGPLLARMGLQTHTTVLRRGYFPQGGGCVEITVEPCSQPLAPIELSDPGQPTRILAFVAGIVNAGGQLETQFLPGIESTLGTVIREAFGCGQPLPIMYEANVHVQNPQQQEQHYPRQGGNKRSRRGRPKREVLHLLLVLETSMGCRLGADLLLEESSLRNLTLDSSAAALQQQQRQLCESLAMSLNDLHKTGACVDEHTFDQLLVYMALARGKSRVVGPPRRLITSLHVDTAIHVIRQITGVEFKQTPISNDDSPLVVEVAEQGLGFMV